MTCSSDICMHAPASKQNVITIILFSQSTDLQKAKSPWICPQKRIDKMAEDEILFRSFQGILNKLTPQNFQVLAEKALWLDINTEKRLIGCTEKILKTVSAVYIKIM